MIGSILEYCLCNASKIWDGSGCGEQEIDKFSGMLFAYMRQRAQWLAISAGKKDRRRAAYRDEGGESEEGEYVRPTTFVRPEQEDALFYKQMIERCDRLPPHEREVARLIFDRATAYEMAQELGVSMKDVTVTTTALARKLEGA